MALTGARPFSEKAVDRQTVIDDAIAQLEAVGSSEVGRHIRVALNKTALRARDRMRESVKDTLGRSVFGPDRMFAKAGGPSRYTVNAIGVTQLDNGGGLEDASVSVFVNARQGVRGADQSAYLKYLFGDDDNERLPGDVGASDKRIEIPRVSNLVLTQHMQGVQPGGRQVAGLYGKLAAKAKAGRKGPSRSEVMRSMASGARPPLGVAETEGGLFRHVVFANALYGEAELRRRLEVAQRNGTRVSSAIAAHARGRDKAGGVQPWDVFKGSDRESGLPAFFARPTKVRDPRGGYHSFRRRNGSIGWMPNMVPIAPEFGAIGKGAGPRALNTSRASTTYQPALERPWDVMCEIGSEMLAEECAREYAHALERRAQGRSF